MAEKKVSVRLVAEGGRRVRAELEGVGEAGARGFGRLSREMELANTRLAAFARRAGLALGAAAAAATASLGLIVRTTVESAAQIRQFAQVANIFIDPDTDDDALKQDLFPRHFIIGLDAPSNYFGAQKVFLDARERHIRLIEDNEDIFPMKHKIDHPVATATTGTPRRRRWGTVASKGL